MSCRLALNICLIFGVGLNRGNNSSALVQLQTFTFLSGICIASLVRLQSPVQVIVTTLWSACSFGHKVGAFAAIKRVIERRAELRSLTTALCQNRDRSSPQHRVTYPSPLGSGDHPDPRLEVEIYTPSPADAASATEQIALDFSEHLPVEEVHAAVLYD
jgi:hypothetical protein